MALQYFLLFFTYTIIVSANSPIKKNLEPWDYIPPAIDNEGFNLRLAENLFNTPEVRAVPENEDYRLPSYAVPSNYKIDLTLPSEIFTEPDFYDFQGVLDLTFTVTTEETHEIKLHGNGLTIDTVTLHRREGDTLVEVELYSFNNYTSDAVTDIITIRTAADFLVVSEEHILHFAYTGKIRSPANMNGLYKSYYVDEQGVTKYLLSTQFESTSARKVFPSFDEPGFKATFDISVTHPSTLVAIGNTPSTEVENGEITTTTFQTTPIMTTYLIALIVSDFTCTEGDRLQDDLPYAVCSRDEAAPIRQYALEMGNQLLKSLEDFTGIRFSESGIGKMHQFAIPDFSAGAMENWGLVTYRETALLYDPEESSNRAKQSIATVIAHEFAHMWFGNLITTHWWSDIFLNEGFATYFELHTTAEVETTWELEKQFVIEDHQGVMQNDATTASHALSHPETYTQTEISDRFSSISYSKGGSIIRMFEHILERTNFQQGIASYLDANRHSNTNPSHLLDALSQFVPNNRLPQGVSFSAVAQNWIEKPGFPLVSVRITGNNIVLSQSRFLTSGTAGDDEKWYVPITYTTADDIQNFENTVPTNWLVPANAELTIPIANLAAHTNWIILNNKQAGFYRVDYDTELLQRIENVLKSDGFSDILDLNRAQIVDDIFNLAKASLQPFSRAFEIFDYLSREDSYYPWYAAMNAINYLLQYTEETEVRSLLQERVSTWLTAVIATVPFNAPIDDDQIYTHKRVLIQNLACRLGISECADGSLVAFNDYRVNGVKVDKNLKTVIYCNALRRSQDPKRDFDFLWAQYQATKLATEQVTILSALGCAANQAALFEYIGHILDVSSGIRAQDVSSALNSVYGSNIENPDIVLDYVIANHQNFGDLRVSINSLINGAASRFRNEAQIERLRAFAETAGVSESVRIYAQSAADSAQRNVYFIRNLETDLKKFLDPTATTTTTTPRPTTTTTVPPNSSPDHRTAFSAYFICAFLIFFYFT